MSSARAEFLLLLVTATLAHPFPRKVQNRVQDEQMEAKTFGSVPDESVIAYLSNINSRHDFKEPLFETDIALPHKHRAVVNVPDGIQYEFNNIKPPAILKRNSIRDRKFVWQDRKIPYLIQQQLSDDTETNKLIKEAIDEFHKTSCITWIPWTTEPHFVFFTKQTGCWSYVGRVHLYSHLNYTYQTLSIGTGCESKGVIMHEMMHVAGFWHEQSRPSRNLHIEVLWENIMIGMEHNFEKYAHRDIDDLNIQYDYKSLMHYGNYAFSKNGLKTLRALADPSIKFGQRDRFSSLDVQELNALYDCSGPDGGWSSWSDYSPCEPVACQRTRQRFCTAEDKRKCPGADQNGLQHDNSSCSPCEGHVDGGWGRWSSWSACTATCGFGRKTRTRICDDPEPKNNGKYCIGDPSMTSACKDRSCNLGPGDCEFDGDGFCSWTQDKNDTSQTDWIRRHFYTPSSYTELHHVTGPSSDHSTGTDYYVYSEATGVQAGKTTGLLSEEFSSTSARCLTFWYYMYGVDMGTLEVYIKPVNSNALDKIWSISGDQGKQWHQALVQFHSTKNYKIVLNAVIGSWYRSDIAVDDVRFNDGKCVISYTGFQENCDFENGFCHWKQSLDDGFDWIRKEGSTGSDSTGPNQDCLTWPGTYAYFEASYPALEDRTAALISKEATSTVGRCMTFWYNMYGADQGKLLVYINTTTSGALNKVWERVGNQGKIWHQAFITVISQKSYQVVIEAVRGKSFRGDIAFDNVAFTDGMCIPTPGPDECHFDNDVETFGSWMQDVKDDFDWIRKEKSTPSSNTGPVRDHTIGTGHYAYFEATQAKEGQKSRLVSRELPATSGRCFNFWYNMNGGGMGKLSVYIKDIKTGNMKMMWERSGDQGRDWHKATIDSIASEHVYQIVMKAVRGKDYRSDIAVDDLVSYEGHCRVSEKPQIVSQCNFDTSMCGYQGSFREGSRSHMTAGPESDHTSGLGSYARLNGSLSSPLLDPQPTLCLRFWYLIFGIGNSVDCLIVRLVHNGEFLQELLQVNGGPTRQWIEGKVLFGSSSTFKLQFTTAHSHTNHTGEIALDDVTLTKGLCTT